nr:hypothetical protein [Tanacetum cinerariifolium]
MMNKKIATILCLLVAQHMFTMKAMELAPTPTNEVDVSEMTPTSILPNAFPSDNLGLFPATCRRGNGGEGS